MEDFEVNYIKKLGTIKVWHDGRVIYVGTDMLKKISKRTLLNYFLRHLSCDYEKAQKILQACQDVLTKNSPS